MVEPGSTFAHSNHGFATWGQIVEDVSGTPLDRYFREHIFEALGMIGSNLVRTERVASRLAETIRGMRMTMAVNALGFRAVALPVGIRDGLPQVVQVIGPRYREDPCLDAAQAIEERLGIITPIDPLAGTGRAGEGR